MTILDSDSCQGISVLAEDSIRIEIEGLTVRNEFSGGTDSLPTARSAGDFLTDFLEKVGHTCSTTLARAGIAIEK